MDTLPANQSLLNGLGDSVRQKKPTVSALEKYGFGFCVKGEVIAGVVGVERPCGGALSVSCDGHLDPGASLLTCGTQKKILSPEDASSCPYRQKQKT